MSLLNRVGPETITVYPEVEVTDEDGNTLLRASDTGIVKTAVIQNSAQSGTSARRAEQDDEGYFTEQNYRLRFSPRSEHIDLGQTSEIEWNGVRWHIVGYASIYNGSNKTAHRDYMIRLT